MRDKAKQCNKLHAAVCVIHRSLRSHSHRPLLQKLLNCCTQGGLEAYRGIYRTIDQSVNQSANHLASE